MSTILEVWTRFEPVGHGSFIRGRVATDNWNGEFHWVYDCGSRRPSQLRGLVEDYYGSRREPIDLLCLSHFDADHVNGLELLLRRSPVKTLVLPYVGLAERLYLATQIQEQDGAMAAQQAAMTASPLRYLSARFSDRIDRIILIKGAAGWPEPEAAQSAALPPPTPTDSPLHIDGLSTDGMLQPHGEEEGYLASDLGLANKLAIASHFQPWRVGNAFEFVFYNSALPGWRTPRSGASLTKVAAEVDGVLRNYEMCSLRTPKRGWEHALRELYDQHFGSSAERRNAISLCAYAAPTGSRHTHVWEAKRNASSVGRVTLEPSALHGDGVLLTGDIALFRRELEALKEHLGEARWRRIRAMQVPHHGSRRSWQPGNSAVCQHKYSVICAPQPVPDTSHPHQDVLDDLPNWVVASYDQSVELAFLQG